MSACAPAIPRGHAACAVPAQRSMLSRRHRDGRMSVVPSSTPKLKQWMIEQVDSEKYPGLVWEDRKLGMFRIPWKHANHQDYRHDKDAAIFEAWARFKGPCRDLRNLNPRTWKSRLRCALHKSSDFVEVPERSQLNNYQPYKVYKIVDSSFSQERMSPSIHLLAVKLEINDSDGMENSQQSSPGTQLGVSEQQAECEVPPLHYQQAESDSSCEPFSGFEASPPEEACVENTSLKWRLPAPDRESPSCAIDLSTVKMEGSGSVGTESSQPGSPYRGQGPSEQHVQSDGAAPTSQQMENDSGCDLCSDSERSTHKEFSAGSPLPDLGLESSMEVRMQSATEPSIPRQEGSKGGSGEQKNVCFLSSNRQLGMSEQAMGDGLVPKPTQTEVDRNGVPSSETATKGESPGGGPQMEWSLTPGAEAARNCTININTMPPSLPEKSNTSPRFINNYTINITSPVPAGQQEKVLSVPHNYTVNIHSAPLPGLPEKAVNSYTINIGSPVPASLPDRAVNSYTINIGSPMPAGFPDRVVNSYTINIGNTIPASLPDRETGNL